MTKQEQMKNVYGYLRVSGLSQAGEERDGLVRQKEAIRDYAAKNGMRIAKWYQDAHSGAKDLEGRKAFHEMMADLKQGSVQTVLIEKLDRLARAVMYQESIILDFQRHGYELVSVCEWDLCSDDPTRILMRQILGAFAQYERSMIVLKLRGARARAKKTKPGWREGKLPLGSKPGEEGIVQLMQALRAEGRTLSQIASELEGKGYKPRHGEKWYPSTIRGVLARLSASQRAPAVV